VGAALVNRLHLPRVDQIVLVSLAAASTFFTLLSWDRLAEHSSEFLVPIFWICLVTGAVGLVLRSVGSPLALVPFGQALLALVFLNHLWAAPESLGGWIPTPASLSESILVLSDGARQAAQWPAPVPATANDFPDLMLGIGTVVVLLVDLLACTMRRVPAAGLPLLAAFTVPVSLLGGVSWLTFALAALCFTLLLTADQATRLARWGHTLTPTSQGDVVDNQPHQVRLGTLWPTATRFAVAGVLIAVFTPVLLPQGLNLFDGEGPGDGSGGNDNVALSNPMVNIQRTLDRGADIDLITVETDDPSPGYLRAAVLDLFDGTTWRPSMRDIPASQRAANGLPQPPGLSPTTPRTTYTSQFEVRDFRSRWLPIPYPTTTVQAPGDWRYDVDTLDLYSMDEDFTTDGLTYSLTSETVRPEASSMVAAPVAPRSVFAPNTELPSTMPPWVTDLAQSVTERGRSQFEKAVILQRWFRTDGGFEYSIERSSGSGLDQLELFLSEEEGGRRGYCEQFSAAMAMMARSLGIPARVAVGFLRPDQVGENRWVYSSHDLHAWPELYFEGAGWVTFEPTPQDQATSVPSYTTGRVPRPGDEPLSDPSASFTEGIRPSASVPPGGATPAVTGDSTSTVWVALPIAVLVLAALLCLPRLLRARIRRRRLGTGRPGGAGRQDGRPPAEVAEGAWAEIRATALDLGLGWDDGATLRQRARALVPALDGERGAKPARGALERLVLLMERSRYSRAGLRGVEREGVLDATSEIVASLQNRASQSVRRRATWLPASLWQSRRVHGGGSARSAAGTDAKRPVDELDQLSV